MTYNNARHSIKLELMFCACSNPTRGVSEDLKISDNAPGKK